MAIKVVGTPSKSKHKIAKISKFWGPEKILKYICHLSNIIAYFHVKNYEILSFQPCLQKVVCYKTVTASLWVLTDLSEVSCTKILFKSILHNRRKASVNKKTTAEGGFYLLRGYIRLLGQCARCQKIF